MDRLATARRLALGATIASAWLLLLAMPASADGGPHVMSASNGSSTLTADSCAACHRTHTAQSDMLLTAPSSDALCITCHGQPALGATTDVESGVQYEIANGDGTNGNIAGALRGGGFVQARIDANDPTRISYPKYDGIIQKKVIAQFSAKVPVLSSGQDVTSAHMHVGASTITANGVAWGNGADGSGAGPVFDL